GGRAVHAAERRWRRYERARVAAGGEQLDAEAERVDALLRQREQLLNGYLEAWKPRAAQAVARHQHLLDEVLAPPRDEPLDRPVGRCSDPVFGDSDLCVAQELRLSIVLRASFGQDLERDVGRSARATLIRQRGSIVRMIQLRVGHEAPAAIDSHFV